MAYDCILKSQKNRLLIKENPMDLKNYKINIILFDAQCDLVKTLLICFLYVSILLLYENRRLRLWIQFFGFIVSFSVS
jgi:hypothetical protein